MSVMQCAFCLEPLNEGASVCKTCGRKQPASKETVRKRVIFATATAGTLVFVLLIVLWVSNVIEGNNAFRDATAAAAWCNLDMSPALIETQVRELHNQGNSWTDSVKIFRTLACGLH